MSNEKSTAAKDFFKRLATGVAQGVAINIVSEKLAPKAKEIGLKLLNRLNGAQGRRSADELEELERQVQSKPGPIVVVTPGHEVLTPVPPPPATKVSDLIGSVEAKFQQ